LKAAFIIHASTADALRWPQAIFCPMSTQSIARWWHNCVGSLEQ